MTDTKARHRNDGLRKLCGCLRRRWPGCKHPWHFSFAWLGRAYRFSLDKHLGTHLDSKSDAEAAAETIRQAIRAGTFTQTPTPAAAPAPVDGLTVEAFGAIFLSLAAKRGGKDRGGTRGKNDRSMLRQLGRMRGATGTPLGDRLITTITEADVETVLAALRAAGRSASTRNKYLQLASSLSRFGVRKGYLSTPWLRPDSDLRRETERHAQRSRRVSPDVERAVLQAAAPRLQRLIIAALDTGARLGELLALTWGDVERQVAGRQVTIGDWLTIRAATTKDGETRAIPIGPRLRALLDHLALDPAGEPHGDRAFLFGTEIGTAVGPPHKAWQTAVLKAHGHEPEWVKGAGRLSAASQAAYDALDLHFHDLRHEAGSRWLEAGWPLHHVRDMLGHRDISTTSRYLNADRAGLLASMRRATEGATATSEQGSRGNLASILQTPAAAHADTTH
ncbi:MAG: site-specific integrase [Burkholderiales bacterium]|nr:site-specific integrase [Burkholderiales bacterium]